VLLRADLRTPRWTARSAATRAARSIAFVLTALPLGAAGLVVVLTGLSLSLALAVTPVLIPVLIGWGLVVWMLAAGEAVIARDLLGAHTGPEPARAQPSGFWRRGPAVLADGRFWKAMAYSLLRVVLGWPILIAELTLLAVGLGGVTAPAWYRFVPLDGGGRGLDFVFWRVDTVGESFLLVPVAALVLALALAALVPIAALWRIFAEAFLPKGDDAVPPRLGPSLVRRRALRIHASVALGISALMTIIWLLTTRGYFWPYWVALPLALSVGVHAFLEWLDAHPEVWRRRRMTRGLATQIGITAIVEAYLIGIWIATTRWYFWPIWPLLAFAIAAAIHWAIVQALRIEHLETVQSETVELQETDLRRIERDLHDGAQARLVALGINLGMAEQKFDTDPMAARALVTEARDGVGDALRELRDLVRGIRPPVLADRGLEAAITALADRSPVRVDVTANVDPRPEDRVETAAYFVVAEALTNAAKHADATRVDVRIERLGPVLRVEVIDDGHGDADPSGSGLVGLRRRVEALRGNLTVSSPAGGPTVVRAELPCGS
jgi:signal transduction histidine kinase